MSKKYDFLVMRGKVNWSNLAEFAHRVPQPPNHQKSTVNVAPVDLKLTQANRYVDLVLPVSCSKERENFVTFWDGCDSACLDVNKTIITDNMASKLPSVLAATEEEIQLLLAAQCHIGTKNCDKQMEPYVWKRRADGMLALMIRKGTDLIPPAA